MNLSPAVVLRALSRCAFALTLAVQVTTAGQGTILIGAPLPLTGGLAREGLKLQRGYDLWAEEVNKAGGISVGNTRMPVKMVYYDYQSNTPRAVQLAEKLITYDKVNFLFSPFGSGATKAASAVSEKYVVPTIAPTACSVEVYEQRWTPPRRDSAGSSQATAPSGFGRRRHSLPAAC